MPQSLATPVVPDTLPDVSHRRVEEPPGAQRDSVVSNSTAVMAEHHQAKQDAKRRCRYREEVDRHNVGNMVIQEGLPRLRQWRVITDSVLITVAFDAS